MKLTSRAFSQGNPIPKEHTGEGKDISPQLTIDEAPDNTVSYALIVDDPDAPMGTFDHWIAWNISSDARELKEGSPVPKQGKNHFGELNYRGPLPPPGTPHRYFFKLYALNTLLTLEEGATKEEVQKAMDGHVLSEAVLMGTYQR